jgi:hypothetical protein
LVQAPPPEPAVPLATIIALRLPGDVGVGGIGVAVGGIGVGVG